MKTLALALALALVCCSASVAAAPSSSHEFELEQPDGQRFAAVQLGDEHGARIETLDGYTVTQNSGGEWVYAEEGAVSGKEAQKLKDAKFQKRTGTGALKPSGSVVGKDSPPGKKHIKPREQSGGAVQGMMAPVQGSPKAVVIPLDFTNKAFSPGRDKAYFENLVFNPSNPSSLYNYCKENSYGQFNLTGIVAGVVHSVRTMEYYGADCSFNDDCNVPVAEMSREAVMLADPNVDFSQYDSDGDGNVDYVIVVHAGNAQEYTSVSNDIWSAVKVINQVVDGKTVKSVAHVAESSPVGIVSHEFGHLLGLIDLYVYHGGQAAGKYDIMDMGCWNNAGNTPSYFSAWNKANLNWLSPVEVSGKLDAGIGQAETNPVAYELNDLVLNGSNGYFLVENRQQTGFDAYIPQAGLIIWHVGEVSPVFVPKIEQATSFNLPAFFSRSFNSGTTPNTDTSGGQQTTAYVNNIGPSSPNMSAELYAGIPVLETYSITNNRSVAQNRFFIFKTGIKCIGGNGLSCGNVQAWLDPAAVNGSASPLVADSSMIGGVGSGEPNSPNTIDGCHDGTSANRYVQNITVTDLNGDVFKGGDNVRVDAVIYASSTATKVNLVYSPGLNPLNWRIIETKTPSTTGYSTISFTFKLDGAAGEQGLRVNLHPLSLTARICAFDTGSSSVDDDDVVLRVVKGKSILTANPGDTPFYVASGAQPHNCGGMKAGDVCEQSWTVNSTGAPGLCTFFAIFNSTVPLMPEYASPDVGIEIVPDGPGVAGGLDYNWTYQNTNTTTARRHKSVLNLSALGFWDYSVSVSKNPSSPGDVIIEKVSDLVWSITGSERLDGTLSGTGNVVLDVLVNDNENPGRTAATQASLDVRMLGDVDGNGYVDGNDKAQMNRRLNSLSVPFIDRSFDFTGNGVIDGDDKVCMNRILNSLVIY